jgi:hypothetical protein
MRQVFWSNPQMTQIDADGEKDKIHAVIESSAQGRASITALWP